MIWYDIVFGRQGELAWARDASVWPRQYIFCPVPNTLNVPNQQLLLYPGGGVSVRVIANGIPLSILASCNLRVCEWSYFRALAPVGTSPQRKKRQLRLGGFTSTSWASIISKRYGGCNRPTARKFLAVIDWSRTNSRCSGKKNSNSATQNKTEKVFLLSSLLSHALLSDSYTLAIFLVVLL